MLPYPNANQQTIFARLVGVTLLATYILILIGASVRASGAGMGCPDWPTCFGMLIPPTSIEQLPPNYQQIYADRGYAETSFNPTKTWIEFGNRMSSVLLGILMLSCLIYGLATQRHNRSLMLLLFGMLGITALQSWMGAVVVASFLHPLVVSTHMVLALAIIAFLHAMLQVTKPAIQLQVGRHIPWLFICGLVLLLQIALGLQVREEVDLLGRELTSKDTALVPRLGVAFSVHIIFSLVALNLFAYTQFRLWRDNIIREHARKWVIIWSIALTSSLVIGAILWLANIPAFLQPLHLLSASVQFGAIWHLLLFALRAYAPKKVTRAPAR